MEGIGCLCALHLGIYLNAYENEISCVFVTSVRSVCYRAPCVPRTCAAVDIQPGRHACCMLRAESRRSATVVPVRLTHFYHPIFFFLPLYASNLFVRLYIFPSVPAIDCFFVFTPSLQISFRSPFSLWLFFFVVFYFLIMFPVFSFFLSCSAPFWFHFCSVCLCILFSCYFYLLQFFLSSCSVLVISLFLSRSSSVSSFSWFLRPFLLLCSNKVSCFFSSSTFLLLFLYVLFPVLVNFLSVYLPFLYLSFFSFT